MGRVISGYYHGGRVVILRRWNISFSPGDFLSKQRVVEFLIYANAGLDLLQWEWYPLWPGFEWDDRILYSGSYR